MDVCLLCLYVVSSCVVRSLRWADYSSKGVSFYVCGQETPIGKPNVRPGL
jgi:hypothetical protein